MKLLLIICIALALTALLWSRINRHEIPQPGTIAPAFNLLDQNKKPHQLSDYQGHWLVLYFYPKDETSICTKEACHFRDDQHQLEKLGAKLLGVSVDNAESHAKFAQNHQLGFPLLADDKGGMAQAYGVLNNIGIFRWASRVTFLIGPDGKIAKVYDNVDASTHSQEIIADLEKRT